MTTAARPARQVPAVGPVLARPEQLRELLAMPLSAEQLAAATAPLGPGLIVAGAGSGKTSVMAARVVWLVATRQVAPDRVLGLTFTNKAAAELAGRIARALRAAGVAPAAVTGAADGRDVGPDDVGRDGDGPAEQEATGEPVVSTYHAFAGRLVAEHGLRLGVEPRSRLLADATRFQLAARVLRRHAGPVVSLTRPLTMLVGELVALDADLSEHLVTPERLRDWDAAWLEQVQAACEQSRDLPRHKTHCGLLEAYAGTARQRLELAELVSAYRRAKRDHDAIDFGDQVALAADLAEHVPEVGPWERARAQVVLLDEYQDTSVAQRRMLAALFGAGHPVTAVGDPCQAIYGWRGASVSNLDGFPRHFPRRDGEPAPTFRLSVNHRSGGRLLALANRVATALRARHVVPELTAPPDKDALGVVRVGLHSTWAQETDWVAEQVAAEVAAGTAAGQCAVLVRARRDVGDLHAALVAHGLPVEVVGLGGLLALPEVADVVAVLEVLEEPTANASLLRLLTGPRWRLGARDLAQLGRRGAELLHTGGPAAPTGRAAAGSDAAGSDAAGSDADELVDDRALEEAVSGIDPCDLVALADAVADPGHRGWSAEGLQRITRLGAELRLLRQHRDEPLLDLVHRVVEVTGLDIELASSPEALAARRREALSAFLEVVAGFRDLDGASSLTAFLAFLRAAQEHERGLDSVTPSGSDAVQLMTVHKAKGLEWDVVACPDLSRTVFPVDTPRGRWPRTAAALPAPLRGDAEDVPSLADLDKQGVAAFEEQTREHLAREERRLAYVAFTRPRRLLIGSGHWWGPVQKTPRGPSIFLDELREHAEEGFGEVLAWEPPPVEDRNPQLDQRVEHAWPAPYDAEPFARRSAAAEQVHGDLQALAEGRGLPEDDRAGLADGEREELRRLDREMQLLLQEEREVRAPVREVPLPAALTASQLLRLKEDPDGLARELARPLPRPPAPAARRGTRFHAWVETLFEARPLLSPDELPGAEDDDRGGDADLLTLQDAFLATEWATRRPFAVEAGFALPLAGRIVRGRIDAVYDLGDGRWQVVDWKTGSESADPLQLAVYRLAWAELRGVPLDRVEASFLYVRTGREVAPADLADRDELERLLRGTPSVEVLTLL